MANFFSSISILIFLVIGLVIGWTCFPKKWLKVNSVLQTVGMGLTIFFMGVALGVSPTFLKDLTTAGWQAALFGIVTVLGSILVVYLLTRLFLKNGKEKIK